MRPTLFTIDQPGPGRLSTMAKPRGGDWLADEMIALHAAGVDILVCALTTAERDKVDLSEEPQAAINAGLQFVSIPILDRNVPDANRHPAGPATARRTPPRRCAHRVPLSVWHRPASRADARARRVCTSR